MQGNDGLKAHDVKGTDSRFHDMIHSVNNDGLEDMAWPGALARHTDKETKGEEGTLPKATQTQKTTQTHDGHDALPPKSQPAATTTKFEEKADKKSRQKDSELKQKPKQEARHSKAVRQEVVIKDEWEDYMQGLNSYDSSKENVKRYGIYLPEKLYNTYQTVFNRDTSAAISVELQKFIDRNRDNFRALISQKSDLFE